MADDLKELHDVEFEMLLQLRRICKKYNLTY